MLSSANTVLTARILDVPSVKHWAMQPVGRILAGEQPKVDAEQTVVLTVQEHVLVIMNKINRIVGMDGIGILDKNKREIKLCDRVLVISTVDDQKYLYDGIVIYEASGFTILTKQGHVGFFQKNSTYEVVNP